MENEETPVEISEDIPTAEAPSRTGAGFLAGMVFGVFLGAGLALLFAPERGEKTRDRVRRRIRALREDALESIDHAGTRTREELRRRRRRLRAELKRIRQRAKERAKEAKESLE
jgi:gas vesicle protein